MRIPLGCAHICPPAAYTLLFFSLPPPVTSMTAGLDFPEKYAPLSAVPRMLFHELDTAHAAASARLRDQPGTKWYYSSAATNLLSRMLRDTFDTHEEYLAFPREVLFKPLGMNTAVLEPDVGGNFVGSSYLYASALDWARFGQLYLQGGVWQGERLLSAEWVEFTRTPVSIAPKRRYGAHWWLNAGTDGNATDRYWPSVPSDASMCLGHDGQLLVVLPSQDAVVVRLGLTRGGDPALQPDHMLARIVKALLH
jgi:CubicO group peptidase (beta-lactamase class C family)